MALQAATNLATYGAKHHKTASALERFTSFMKSAKFDEKKLKIFTDLSLPKYKTEKPDDKIQSSNMSHAHEFIKSDPKKASICFDALT